MQLFSGPSGRIAVRSRGAFLKRMHLRSKMRRSKARVLERRVPNAKLEERLRFRFLRGKSLALKKRTAMISYDLEASLRARPGVQVQHGVLLLRSIYAHQAGGARLFIGLELDIRTWPRIVASILSLRPGC